MRGIGTDIIEIERIAAAIEKTRFMQRVYTKSEQAYIAAAPQPAQSAAGLFCAKEAVSKALGTGIGSTVKFTDIEVEHTAQGAPSVLVRGYESMQFLLSISHCRDYAMATALVWES